MCKSICGINCNECNLIGRCSGCAATGGIPFGKQCFAAKYIKIGGAVKYEEYKKSLINEINGLNITGMSEITELYPMLGELINIEFTLPNSKTVKFLDDNTIYLANQIECEFDNECRFGICAGTDFLLVCEYGENKTDSEIILYKKR